MNTFKQTVVLSDELSSSFNIIGPISCLAYRYDLSAHEIKGLDNILTGMSSDLSITVNSYDTTEFAKQYVIKQGEVSVETTIDIPKQVYLTALSSDTISIEINNNEYISAYVRNSSIGAEHLTNSLSNYISSIRDDVDDIGENYFNLKEQETVLCSTTFEKNINAYFNNITDRIETRISDVVSIENNFGSMYNGIANIINACKLNIDFNLACPISSAFDSINKIGKQEKLSVEVEELDLFSSTVNDGFRVLSEITSTSNYVFYKNLGEELEKIDKRFDVIENSIALMNQRLSSIEEFFKNHTLVVK